MKMRLLHILLRSPFALLIATVASCTHTRPTAPVASSTEAERNLAAVIHTTNAVETSTSAAVPAGQDAPPWDSERAGMLNSIRDFPGGSEWEKSTLFTPSPPPLSQRERGFWNTEQAGTQWNWGQPTAPNCSRRQLRQQIFSFEKGKTNRFFPFEKVGDKGGLLSGDTSCRQNKIPQEEPRELSLSMDEAVAMALRENARLSIARLEWEKARSRIGEAWATALPHIRGTLAYTRKDEIATGRIMGMTFSAGDEDNWNAEVALRQNLSLWTPATAIAIANLYKDWTEQQIRSSEQQTVFLTKKLYLDLLLARNTLERNNQMLILAEEHAANTKKLREQGVATEFDLLRANVQVANMKALVSQARSAINVAMVSLVRMLGQPYDTIIHPVDTLKYMPLDADMRLLVAEALSQRPEILQARLAVGMQEKNVSLVKQEFLPTLAVQYSYGNERPSRKGMFDEPEWEDYWFIGVILSYPLFEGGLTRAKLIKEKAVLRQQELACNDIIESVKAEIYQAVQGLRDAAELVESQAENVRQAEESVRLAQVGYANGVNTSLEVLDSQTALATARTNYLQAVYSHCIARIALEKALGR